MKKLIISLLILLSFISLQANIFIPPGANISELYFDSEDNWSLEISYFDAQREFESIDSILIFTPKSRYKLNCQFDSTFDMKYMVISSNDVGDSLIITSQGDSIGVKTYWNAPEPSYLEDEHALIFGVYNNSMIDKPEPGHSICYFENFKKFFIHHPNPSLGQANRTGSAFAYIKGKMYNANTPITKGLFALSFQFYPTGGDIVTPVLPGEYTINEVAYLFDKDYHQWYSIEPVNLNANAGDTVYTDIHITDPEFVGLKDSRIEEKMKVFPNPASNTINIKFESAELAQKACKVKLYNAEGKEVFQKLFNSSSALQLDISTFAAGIYTMTLEQDRELISTEKIIVNPF